MILSNGSVHMRACAHTIITFHLVEHFMGGGGMDTRTNYKRERGHKKCVESVRVFRRDG